jgi:hypothetical protein
MCGLERDGAALHITSLQHCEIAVTIFIHRFLHVRIRAACPSALDLSGIKPDTTRSAEDLNTC